VSSGERVVCEVTSLEKSRKARSLALKNVTPPPGFFVSVHSKGL